MTSSAAGLVRGPDGLSRCWWCLATEEYRAYHDTEWGRATTDDRRLFEKICLEGFQAGLSWLTILRKREAFRRAFAGFDYEQVARFTPRRVETLLADAAIVRHRGKIESAINNARRARELVSECGSLAAYFWRWQPDRGVAPAAHHPCGADGDEHHARLDGALEGPQAARVDVRRPHDRVRLHAGDGAGERSRGGVLREGGAATALIDVMHNAQCTMQQGTMRKAHALVRHGARHVCGRCAMRLRITRRPGVRRASHCALCILHCAFCIRAFLTH